MRKRVLGAAILMYMMMTGVLGAAILMYMVMTGASMLMMENQGWKYALSLMEEACLMEYHAWMPWKETAS